MGTLDGQTFEGPAGLAQMLLDTPALGRCVSTQVYRFAGAVNSVPLTATEFPFAARDFVIVFAGPDIPMPAAILGVQQNKNLFVADDGHWQGRYIPAFVRRYPFVFSSNEDNSTFTLCVDKTFQGLNEEGRGERLFSDEGDNTAYLEKMLKFLQEYQVQFQRTQAFCKQLKDNDLFESMQAQISLPSGSQQSLTGFQVINRDRLKALDGDKLAELAKTDALELAYLHLQSLNNFSVITERASAGSSQSN